MRFGWLAFALAACTSSASSEPHGVDAAVGTDAATGADASGADGSVTGSTTPLVECVKQTNAYRATLSLPALTESPQLEAYAATGAQSDYQSMTAHGHFTATSGGGIAFAENECPGFDGWNLSATGGDQVALVDQCLKAFYDEGPGPGAAHGHYTNMMNPSYTSLGCGIYVDATTGNWTLTQDYGM